ncbi:HisS family protein [Anaerolineales bacterium HSG24]|nr:HisS family protein [Anaerolineales bacterium HSG24]
MAKKAKPRIPAGMRDVLPRQMIKRQYVIDVIKTVFESFSFEPLQTPAIEMSETLKGKYGPDAERLIYNATYGSGTKEDISLRYDLSVPLCRMLAMYPKITKPFKRYQIAPVWRADRPQKGRYREFYQCDADTVGSSSILADAEIVNVIYEILARLGFKNFVININHRKILKGIGQFAGVPDTVLGGLYRSIDKIGKIGITGVERELKSVGLPSDIIQKLVRSTRLLLQNKLEANHLASDLEKQKLPDEVVQAMTPELLAVVEVIDKTTIKPKDVQEEANRIVGQCVDTLRNVYQEDVELIPDPVVSKLLSLLQISGPNRIVLAELRKKLADSPTALEGISELEEMTGYLENLGIPEQYYVVDFSMVRGLEYYTGPIFETVVKEPKIGSITGGGRFDELVGMFVDRSYPATGTTIGIERIIDVMEDMDMFPPNVRSTVSQVLISYFDETTVAECLNVANMLRQAGVKTEMYFDKHPLRDQMGYANSKDIPLVVVIGPDELANEQVTIRNMASKEQQQVKRAEVVTTIKEWLASAE